MCAEGLRKDSTSKLSKEACVVCGAARYCTACRAISRAIKGSKQGKVRARVHTTLLEPQDCEGARSHLYAP